jgi:2'-5' RNA ligase
MPNGFFTLLLTPDLEQGVRDLWRDLETIGIHFPEPERYRPHITLTGFDIPNPAACSRTLQMLCSNHPPIPIRLHHLGLFPELSVLFLEPRMTRALAQLHRNLIQEITNLPGLSPPFSHYDIDTWVPHCTLAANIPPNLLGTAITKIQSRWRTLEGHAIGIGLFVPPIKSDYLLEHFCRNEIAV